MTIYEAIRTLEEDFDVFDDCIDDDPVAVCPPMDVTEQGKEAWADVLQLEGTPGTYWGDCPCFEVKIDHLENAEKMHKRLMKFLYSLAGYCPEDEYNLWFIEEPTGDE